MWVCICKARPPKSRSLCDILITSSEKQYALLPVNTLRCHTELYRPYRCTRMGMQVWLAQRPFRVHGYTCTRPIQPVHVQWIPWSGTWQQDLLPIWGRRLDLNNCSADHPEIELTIFIGKQSCCLLTVSIFLTKNLHDLAETSRPKYKTSNKTSHFNRTCICTLA